MRWKPDGDSAPEWQRFRRALLFFLACLSVSLFAIGLYH
jgi:hypothetical protein